MEGNTSVEERRKYLQRRERSHYNADYNLLYVCSLTDLPNESVTLDVDMARQAQLADISECHIKTLAYACRKCKSVK